MKLRKKGIQIKWMSAIRNKKGKQREKKAQKKRIRQINKYFQIGINNDKQRDNKQTERCDAPDDSRTKKGDA